MSSAKAVVVVLWLVLFSSFFIATGSTPSAIGRLAFWVLVITHLVECAIFFPTLRSAPGPLAGHLVRTFCFGFFHVRDVRALPSQEATHS